MTANAAWNIWNFRKAVVQNLISEGHDVTILSPADDSVADLEAIGCRFMPLEMSVKGLNPISDLALMRRFRRVFRVARPDVVLSYTIKNNIYGAFAARLAGIPFVPNVTGLGTAFLSGGWLQGIAEALYRTAFSRLSVVFFQNEDDRDLFLGRRLISSDQAHLLPGSGIDLAHFNAVPLPPAEEGVSFLLIARLLRDKGVVEFVEAARKIKASRPDVSFRLLGAAGSQNRSAIDRATVQNWQEEGVIEYLGTTKDVRPFIEASTCIVLPSYREGAPRTLIEAASMARPVIATDVPGCRAVVEHGETGFLCVVRSSESLARMMERFLGLSREARVAMGQAGRNKMEREFDKHLVVEAYRNAILKTVQLR
ncbi:glycosyltransferase family 4 protein [Parvibaculum indicum]|uniref:glycosyltransferase family 4 protein n=1 Tax=Parvibaculum indicum TaxID=562969 RepID=UPI0014200039|nr:glycosyltransferase family 4 protein [Parvibaculum indicum]